MSSRPLSVVLSTQILEAIRDWVEQFHANGVPADDIAKGIGIAAAGFCCGSERHTEQQRRANVVRGALDEALPIIAESRSTLPPRKVFWPN